MAMEGFNQVWNIGLTLATPYAVKAALKLGVFNIISQSGDSQGVSLDAILHKLPPESQRDKLHKLLKFLVVKKVLSLDNDRYKLTGISKLLVSENNDMYQGSLLKFLTDGFQWEHMDATITSPGKANAFVKGLGMDPHQYVAENPSVAKMFEEARVSMNKATMAVFLETYDGFKGLKKLVDVGGGKGSFIGEIVKTYPHIEGINFDLPSVLGDTPPYPGVTNVPGNALEMIPPTDGIFMKTVVHLFDDPEASKLLQNCYDALEKNGKIIICDLVMEEDKEESLQFEMLLLAGANLYERSEGQWESLLNAAGFDNIKFFNKGTVSAIVEATK